jgi:hypothetical protein
MLQQMLTLLQGVLLMTRGEIRHLGVIDQWGPGVTKVY